MLTDKNAGVLIEEGLKAHTDESSRLGLLDLDCVSICQLLGGSSRRAQGDDSK